MLGLAGRVQRCLVDAPLSRSGTALSGLPASCCWRILVSRGGPCRGNGRVEDVGLPRPRPRRTNAVAMFADEAVATFASTADKASTADETVATFTSMTDEAVAEASSTADEASTGDKAAAAFASTAD